MSQKNNLLIIPKIWFYKQEHSHVIIGTRNTIIIEHNYVLGKKKKNAKGKTNIVLEFGAKVPIYHLS